jgi:hypothetical protein
LALLQVEDNMLELFPVVWNGTLREHYLLLFSVAGSIALTAGFLGAWLGARFANRRMVQLLRETLPTNQQQAMTNAQLDELSGALDAVALEVERLAEGQRFTAKLLADNAPSRHVSTRVPGAVTPH